MGLPTDLQPDEVEAAAAELCESLLECGTIFVAILLATLISCTALGGLVTFACSRLRLWPFSDGRLQWRRAVVLAAVLLQVLQTMFDVSRVLKIYAFHFGNRAYFRAPRWEDAAAFALGILIMSQTQLSFLERAFAYSVMLKVNSKIKWALTIVIFPCILVATGFGFAVALEIKLLDSFALLIPGQASASIYGTMIITWTVTSAIVDIALCSVMTAELLAAKRRAEGSIKGGHMLVIFRRLSSIILEAGIFLAAAQTATAIAWIVEAANHHPRASLTWIYFPLLLLPKIYTITFLRFTATSHSASTPTAQVQHSSSHHPVGTVEYKLSPEGAPHGPGIPTVTGLPLDASPIHVPPTLDEESTIVPSPAQALRHKTSAGSKLSLSTKPSLETINERAERRRFPPSGSHAPSPTSSTHLGDPARPCSPTRSYSSPFHVPRSLDPAASTSSVPDVGGSFDGLPPSRGRGRRMGRRSSIDDNDFEMLDEYPPSPMRFAAVRGGSLDISDPRPSEHTLLASARLSLTSSPSRPPLRRGGGRGRSESAVSRDDIELGETTTGRMRRFDYSNEVGTSSL